MGVEICGICVSPQNGLLNFQLLYFMQMKKGGESMAQTEAQLRASKKYHDKFDDIKVRVPKGVRQEWQDHAASQNESLNSFISRAVSETMKRDKEQ